MRVAQRRCALYGLLIYPQRDRARFFFGYGFYRNEVVLLADAHKPAHGNVHKPKGPLLVHVDVFHVADEAAAGVEDAPLAEVALWGTRVLGELKPGELHGALSLLFGGKKGALLTACWTTTVRSGAIRPRRDGRFSATLRAEGGTHRPCVECIDRTGTVQKEGYVPKYVEGEFCELHTDGVLGSCSSPCMPSYWPRYVTGRGFSLLSSTPYKGGRGSA